MHVVCEGRAVVALQVQEDEWLEEAKWGAFGQTLYEGPVPVEIWPVTRYKLRCNLASLKPDQ